MSGRFAPILTKCATTFGRPDKRLGLTATLRELLEVQGQHDLVAADLCAA